MSYNQPRANYAKPWTGLCMMPNAIPARKRCSAQCQHCETVEQDGMLTKREIIEYITSPQFPRRSPKTKPLNLYLASRYSRRDAIISYAEVLMGYGFNITSRWIRGYHQASNEQLYPGSDAEQFARDDLNDIEDADELILFTDPPRTGHPSRGGQFVEFGYALGRGIPVTIVGKRANVFCCLENILQFETFGELLAHLESEGHPITESKGVLKA